MENDNASIDPDSLLTICSFIKTESGIELGADKKYLVEGRLRPLLKRLQLEGFEDLARCLKARSDQKILKQVVEAATTNETFFFRDVAPFKAFENTILPQVLKNSKTGITIWSAACSSGQEPYSLAMIINERHSFLWDKGLKIYASDLSEDILDRAKQGNYRQLEVNRGLPAPLLVKYFKQDGENWQIDKSLRARVNFFKQNLLSLWTSVPPCDVIFMRNVLIYFNLETKQAILKSVRQKLKPHGFLILGAAETTLNIDSEFSRVACDGTSVYVKKGAS